MSAPNTAVNVPDEFCADDMFVGRIAFAQQATITDMVDTLFASQMRSRPAIDEAIAAAFRLQTIIEGLIEDDGDDDYGSLGESKELAGSILTNLGGCKSNSAKQHVDHGARCRCDNCVAALSDEHFDRAGAR